MPTSGRDAGFVRLLDDYRRSPRSLGQEDRVRARSWLRSAARVYAMSLEGADADLVSTWLTPSMGENRRVHDLPTNEDLIDLDPEFLSFLDALRQS